MRGVRVGAMVVVALLLVGALPTSSSQAVGEPVPPAAARTRDEIVLRVAVQDDLRTFNPLAASDAWTWNVLNLLYDTPMRTDLVDEDRFVPHVAVRSSNCTAESLFNLDNESDWEQLAKAGQMTVYYDFTGVTFHDGHQMDLDDVIFSLGVAALWPGSSNYMRPLMVDEANYTRDRSLAVRKISETTLRFFLQEPYAEFARDTLAVRILPQHIWGTTLGGQTSDEASPLLPSGDSNSWDPALAMAFENYPPVGSGPFKFGNWTAGSSTRIDTWRDYCASPQPHIDAIIFNVYKTAEQAVQALEQGDVDYIAWSVPPAYVPDMAQIDGVCLVTSAQPNYDYMAFNMRRKSFGYFNDNPEAVEPTTGLADPGKIFRRAVAHCVDKAAIVERILQNFGVVGTGPISPQNEPWWNASMVDYEFGTERAMEMLDHGADGIDGTADDYQLTDPTQPPGWGNWWKNPDGSDIGSGEGGKVEILTPPADYDIRQAMPGLMIATAMQAAGIFAESVAMDYWQIQQRVEERDFDMFIGTRNVWVSPVNLLYDAFHSDNAAPLPEYILPVSPQFPTSSGMNHAGYRNSSFDALVDSARSSDDRDAQVKAVQDAQGAIVADQPVNVLFFRTNVEAYRSDGFVNWTQGDLGSIFCWQSLVGIHPPGIYRLAGYLSAESPVPSDSPNDILVTVKDQDDVPVEGAAFRLTCSAGEFSDGGTEWNGTTGSNGLAKVAWTAPNVPISAESDTRVTVRLVTATKDLEGVYEYDPAPSREAIIVVKPEGSTFLRVRVSVETNVMSTGEVSGIEVFVRDQNGMPVEGATVTAQPAVAGPTVTNGTTDVDGMARLTFTAPEEIVENETYAVEITVAHSSYSDSVAASMEFTVLRPPEPTISTPTDFSAVEVVAVLAVMAAVVVGAAVAMRRRRRSP